MAEFFDYDPLKGVTEYFDYEEDTGLARIHSVQDVSPVLDRARELRNTGASDDRLKEDDYLCLYASIPTVVILELRKKGINIYDRDHHTRMIQEIDANYPWLKATYKTDAAPLRKIV